LFVLFVFLFQDGDAGDDVIDGVGVRWWGCYGDGRGGGGDGDELVMAAVLVG